MHDVIVKIYVDVLEALQHGSLSGAVFAFDSRSYRGSWGLGSDELMTVVRPGDRISWAVLSLECEAFVNVREMELPGWLAVEHVRDAQRDYWRATVVGEVVTARYAMEFEIGRYGRRMRLAPGFGLVPMGSPGDPAYTDPAVATVSATGDDR